MRYYSKEHNRLMLSPKVEKPEMKIGSKYDLGFTYDHEWFIRDLTAYNEWLSKGLEIQGEHNWKDGQEVEEDIDYEVKGGVFNVYTGFVCINEERLDDSFIDWAYHQVKLVAIPKKEKDFEPSNSNPDLDSVASHTCSEGNSIEQGLKVIIDDLRAEIAGAGVNLLEGALTQKERGYYAGVQIVCKDVIVKLSQLLNSDKNVKASVATEADSSNPV